MTPILLIVVVAAALLVARMGWYYCWNTRAATILAHHLSRILGPLVRKCPTHGDTTCCGSLCFAKDDISGVTSGLRLGMKHEPWMAEVIQRHRNKDAIALDVGAHIGYHTRDMAANFGHVIALEADPATFKHLKRNTSDLSNVTCRSTAVGSETGEAAFSRDPISTRSGVLPGTVSGGERGLNVPVRTLDSLAEDGTLAVKFIKIDVEGNERKVLSGGRRLLRRRKPVIVYEDHTGETTEWLLENCPFYEIERVDATNLIAGPKARQPLHQITSERTRKAFH